jgi:hypothetical protein
VRANRDGLLVAADADIPDAFFGKEFASYFAEGEDVAANGGGQSGE